MSGRVLMCNVSKFFSFMEHIILECQMLRGFVFFQNVFINKRFCFVLFAIINHIFG